MKKRLRKKLAKLAGMSRIVMVNTRNGLVYFDRTPWGGTVSVFQTPLPPQVRIGKRFKLQSTRSKRLRTIFTGVPMDPKPYDGEGELSQ